MRAAVIGAFFAADEDARSAYASAATRLTHTDPRALTGARAVAEVAAFTVHTRGARPGAAEMEVLLRAAGVEDGEWQERVTALLDAEAAGRSVAELVAALGLEAGVSGYVHHTVPVALYAWWRHHGDFAATVTAALDCGGDTDTVGAIAGALAGAVTGEAGIPRDWVDGIAEFPRSTAVLRAVADRLACAPSDRAAAGPVSYAWPLLPARNALFLGVVLLHGLRRLLPPY